LTIEDTTDSHLEEATKTHNFKSEEEKQAWLRSIKAFESYYDDNYDQFGNKKPQDYLNDLDNQYHFKTLEDTEEIWFYDQDKGIYLPNGEHIIKASLQSQLGRDLTIKKTNEAIAQIERSTYTIRDEFDPDILWIATKNCMINLMSGETKPFSHKFMCTTNIPVFYDHGYPTGSFADFFRLVEGQKSSIMKFLSGVMNPEDVDLFLDFLAYCLYREYKYNFWLLLVGKGLNGKSILLRLIERFLGSDNVSGETLHRLLKERFSVGNLFQKMVNVDADVSYDTIFNNTGVLKKLTGNDLHIGEHKYKKPFKFRSYAKLIFSCNKIPETEDDTDAFYRRILQINFTQQFFGEKDDPNLIDKLTTQEELSILLHELLSRLPRILEHGLRKITNEAMEKTYNKFTMSSNPVKYFYEAALCPEAGSRIPKLDMYEHYQKFCQIHKLTPESDQSFSRKLTQDYKLRYKPYKINSEFTRCWIDVKLVDWQKTEEVIEEIGDFTEAERNALR
jgi:P4 family phage/plasmid primase-like protien